AVPAGWSAPQTTTPGAAGYVTATDNAGGTKCGANPTVSAAGGTITLGFSCAAGKGFTVSYASTTTPATGVSTFTTKTSVSGGTLTNIATPPTVTDTNDGTGTMTVTPTPVVAGSTNSFTFTLTNTGSGTLTAATVVVPAGWTAPQSGGGAGSAGLV